MNNVSSDSVSAYPAQETTTPTWAQMVQEHGEQVFRLAYRLTGNRQDAEDLSQEAFVRAFNALEKYTPGTMGGWLHRITTNIFLDQARRKSKIRFDAFAEGSEERLPGNVITPERYYEYNNLDVDVQEALRSLSPEFRAAIVLCDMEGFSYEEVSRILDVKLGTVRSRIHRGRAMLRDALAHRNPANRPPKTMSLPRIPRGLRPAN